MENVPVCCRVQPRLPTQPGPAEPGASPEPDSESDQEEAKDSPDTLGVGSCLTMDYLASISDKPFRAGQL
jgi:hypothetical protein